MKYIFARLFQSKFIRGRELKKYFWNSQSIKAKRKNRYLAEQMEARYLLSADLAPFAGDQALRDQIDHQQVIQQVVENGHLEAEDENQKPRLQREVLPDFFASNDDVNKSVEERERFVAPDDDGVYFVQQLSGDQVVVVDTSIDDYEILLDRFMGPAVDELEFTSVEGSSSQVATYRGEAATVSVVLLADDSQEDSLEVIGRIMSDLTNISAMHVLSHAQSGELALGNTVLNSENLSSYESVLRAWGDSLTDSGDILFYGCNLSQGEAGFDFIERLAGITQADIAASENLTGNGRIGGDWILETEFGSVEVASAFSSNDPRYDGVLLAEHVTGQTTAVTESSDYSASGSTISVDPEVDTLDISVLSASDGVIEILVAETGLITVVQGSKTGRFSNPSDSDIEGLIFGSSQNVVITLASGASLPGSLSTTSSTFSGSLEIVLQGTTGTNNINFDNEKISRFGKVSGYIFDKITSVTGHAGEDIMRGEHSDADNIGVDFHGGAGDDWVYGSEDNDTLSGDAGSDILRGLGGTDTLIGGDGDDTYVVSGDDWVSGDVAVTITEQDTNKSGNDILDLTKVDAGLTITIDNTVADKNKLAVTADKTISVTGTNVEVSHTTTGGPVSYDASANLPKTPATIADVTTAAFNFFINDGSGATASVNVGAITITEAEIREAIGSVESLEDEIISADVSASISMPIPDVDLKPGGQVWLSLIGNVAFWDSANSDGASPDAYVENGVNETVDINLSQYFSVPASGVSSPAHTFTLALGHSNADALGRVPALVQVTLPSKTYSGTTTEIKAEWTRDIQEAINSAIEAKTGDTIVEMLKAPVTVNQVFGRMSMVTDSGSIAFWNDANTGGAIDREVRGSGDAGAEILLMDYFTVDNQKSPNSSSPITITHTFSLALGEYAENALSASAVAFQVTVQGKDYSSYGSSSEMYKAWASDVQNAIDQAFTSAQASNTNIQQAITNEKLTEVILQLWQQKVETEVRANGTRGGVDLNNSELDIDVNDEGMLFIDTPLQTMTVSNTSTTVSEQSINFSVNGKNVESIKVPNTGLSSTTYKLGTISAEGQIALSFDGEQNNNLLDLSSITNDMDVNIFGDGQVKVTIHLASGVYVVTAEGLSDVILGKGSNNNIIFSESGSLTGSLRAAAETDLNATSFNLAYDASFEGDAVVNNTSQDQVDGLYEAVSVQNSDDSWMSLEDFVFNFIDLAATDSEGLVFSEI